MEMPVVNYAARIWFVAHLIHFSIMAALFMPLLAYGGYLFVFAIPFVVSLPAIFVFWGVLHLIINSNLSAGEKFLRWAIISPLVIAINAFLFLYVIADHDFLKMPDMLILGLPSVVTTIISTLAQSSAFFKINTYMIEKKEHEKIPGNQS